MKMHETNTFIFWPSSDVERFTGLFYVDSDSSTKGEGLFVGLEINQVMNQTFFGQSLGIFNFEI
jgi:hypothetical protein